MAKIYSFEGVIPVIDPTAYIHPEAVIIGDVFIGPGCYVAPMASIRGDFGRIIVRKGSNIQDSCTLHSFPGKVLIVEEDGHIGHGAIVHGCHLRRGALIGMNAVVMDGSIVGEYSIVAANSFVKAGFEVPDRHLVAGTPARIVRELGESDINWKKKGTRLYQGLAIRSINSIQLVEPLSEASEEREMVSWEDHKIKPLFETKKDV
ncbi:MAG: phenylacetic acid degradation protein PaaY [Proteobacteria bacterium]|nr:phenylacetic acid degradation protein PaaY [Pseudomonadota bacterium]